MKLKNVISRVDGMKPNAFSNEVKTGWVNELENMVQTEIFLLAPEEMVEYTWEENAESELLIRAPYSKLYWIYLSAMIDFTHGEYDKYSQTMQMFNAWLQEYQIWYARTFRPADGGAVRMGYYLSAYGLAKLHGFEGTEEDWLEALRGEKGDPFTYEDFTPEQLEALRGPEGEMLVSLERTAGDGSPGTVDTYTVTSNTGKTWSLQVRNGPVGPRGEQGKPGETGKAFTYDMFTEEQLEALRGPAGPAGVGEPGQPGMPGKDGMDGFSPVVTVAKITNGHRVTITDASGTKTFDVMDGEDGEGGGGGGENGTTFYPYVDENGNLSWTNDGGLENPGTVNIKGPEGKPGQNGGPGADGYTPEKGKDYWTEADKQEIIEDLKDEGISGATAKTATLTTSGWAQGADGRYAQTVSVAGVTTDESQVIVVDVHLTGTDTAADAEAMSAWGPDDGSGPSSNNIKQGNGTLTFYCTAVPAINIPLIVGVH